MKVLVVDDEAGFRDFLKWELGNRGFEVTTAVDGVEGLAKAREEHFEVIITDVTMPRMNGIELLEKVKKTSPESRFILVTGFGAVETAVYAMQQGASEFILKPYDMEYLMNAVNQAALASGRCKTCDGSGI